MKRCQGIARRKTGIWLDRRTEPGSRGRRAALGRCSRSRPLLRLLARNRLLRIVARGALGEAGGIEETEHAVGRLGALRQPVLNALGVERHALLVALRQDRIVGADDLDEAA